ncbi:VENN motif pre-toxin domain-containing protein [Pectobacterium brasiliense]|nr:VENN motif pre-toxin domain-containing protein [Pectobacterium brasiliense]
MTITSCPVLKPSSSSHFYTAVSDGTLLLRDTAKQVQDIATLSRDVEHANNALSPIFNKEKEQKRLKQAQLIGEIGAQVMDIVRTEGELKAQKAAEAKGDSKVERPKDGDSAQEWEVYKKALTESPTYKAEMQKYGTGSDFQRAAQAATAAIQALAGGDIQKAIASGASPYLAQLVKDVTIPKDESKITASDIAANAMAHAVVGAVVAQLSGQDAAAGAIGASSGELAARAIMAAQYPGKTANDLTEAEKQSVSALSTLASGLVSGLASNSTASAASGAQSGRNAVENNYLSDKDITTFTEKYANAKTDEERDQLKAELSQLDKDKQHQALSTGIPLKEQKAELEKLKLLAVSADCVGQCQELVSYSISQLEPVVNNPQLHQDNINKGILAAVISGLTLERPIGGSSNASPLTREQQELIRKAESISTAKGIQNPFPRDLNEQVLWNQIKKSPSSGEMLQGMNKDPRFPKTAGFQKMQVIQKLSDGTSITVHYQYNSYTGKAYDMKITTPQRFSTDPSKVIDSIKDKVK